MEFQCDVDCPANIHVSFCCRNCARSKSEYKNKTNQHLWSDTFGFWDNGCKLSRDQMPTVCKEYDCKEYRWVVERVWVEGKWKEEYVRGIHKSHKVIGILTDEGDKKIGVFET